MPSIINATTTNGVAISPDNSGSLQLATNNGTTAVTIDTSQNVGIGTSSPATRLDLLAASGETRITLRNVGNASDSSTYVAAETGSVGDWANLGLGARHAIRFYTVSTERMRINSGGDLIVGSTSKVFLEKQNLTYSGSTNYGFAINETTAGGTAQQIVFYKNSSAVGSVTSTTGGTAYNTTSDYRLKENIAPMTDALATVAQLKPCTYTWKVDGSTGQGFIAHELQAVVPDCVTGEKDGTESFTDEDGVEHTRPKYQGIDTSFLVATLTAAIQELKAELDTVKAELNTLKNPPVEGTE